MICEIQLLELIRKMQPIKARKIVEILWKERGVKIERRELNSRLYKLQEDKRLTKNGLYEWSIAERNEDKYSDMDKTLTELKFQKAFESFFNKDIYMSILADSKMGYRHKIREELERYNLKVLRPNNPNVLPNKQILNPAMIFALIEYLPVTYDEFQGLIPDHLRKNIDPLEGGEHLVAILEIIRRNSD